MEPPRIRCVLDVAGGPARRVDRGGVWIGRQGDCDLVVLDPRVSRRHALVRIAADHVEVVPLGPLGIAVNGADTTKPRVLADGDTLELPGFATRVSISVPRPGPAPSGFLLAIDRGGSFGISCSPFVVGGGERDDVIIAGWPVRLFVFHVAGGALFVETPTEGDALVELAPGDTLRWTDRTLHIATAAAETTTSVTSAAPTRVEVEILPRGGCVTFTIGGLRQTVYLADRRLDLVMALVRCPGAFISDDALRTVVWPRNKRSGRAELNMLISRCRRDLVEAGLAGPRLIERSPQGGATRLVLAPGAEVVVSP